MFHGPHKLWRIVSVSKHCRMMRLYTGDLAFQMTAKCGAFGFHALRIPCPEASLILSLKQQSAPFPLFRSSLRPWVLNPSLLPEPVMKGYLMTTVFCCILYCISAVHVIGLFSGFYMKLIQDLFRSSSIWSFPG